MGKPKELAIRYYDQGADELLYIDTVASLYGRNNLTEVVREAASHVFIPMTVGGGVRSVDDALNLLRCGADKIAVNTAIVYNSDLLSEMSKVLGSQSVIASIQVKSKGNGKWEVFVDNGREQTGIDAVYWARRVEELGAGELLVTSVDRDGTKQNFDTEIIRQISEAVSIPVIASGGAKAAQDVTNIIKNNGASAVAVATSLHYGNLTIEEIKLSLKENDLSVANH